MERGLIYEYLVCKAFNCERRGIDFADADIYRMATTKEKQERLAGHIASSIKILLEYADISDECRMLLKECFDEIQSSSSMFDIDNVLDKLIHSIFLIK